jgi:hypothetical protein
MKESALSKVPEVTLIFWIVKILATTLGETGGDALSMLPSCSQGPWEQLWAIFSISPLPREGWL